MTAIQTISSALNNVQHSDIKILSQDHDTDCQTLWFSVTLDKGKLDATLDKITYSKHRSNKNNYHYDHLVLNVVNEDSGLVRGFLAHGRG